MADGPGGAKASLAPTAELESGQVQASEPQPTTVTAIARFGTPACTATRPKGDLVAIVAHNQTF